MLIIIGPSASGKTQIVNHLIRDYQMQKMITYTTRAPREGEVDGIDYYFISQEEFIKKINHHFFLEHVCYNHNYYGTAKNELSSNKVVIVKKEKLKAYIKKAKDQIKIVYIQCSKKIREKRMIERKDDKQSIQVRLAHDDEIFDEEIAKLADLVIDTSYSDILDDTKKIYDFYRKYLKK